MAVGFTVPLAAVVAPTAGFRFYAPMALGLLPAGLYLVTRPQPKRATSAILASLLLPAGAGMVLWHVATPEALRRISSNASALLPGATLLTVGGIHAWLTWARRDKERIHSAAQVLAVVIWIVFGAISLQIIGDGDGIDYIEPLAMRLDGADLTIEVPHQGGCADRQLTVETQLRPPNVLEVLVYNPDGFRCLAGCLYDASVVCTETVRHRLTRVPPAGTTAVAAPRPATGLQRVPLAFTISGIVLGATLWIGAGRAAQSCRR